MLADGRCIDGLQEELAGSKLYLNVTRDDWSIEPWYISTNQIGIRSRFLECDRMRKVREDDYILFEVCHSFI
ncbi:hypothetical protein M5D96_008513 [Drosophila gunungcola]|uniref:Uncharacterized protein n=1 Tax=Drosophila gunungcola TaxID=103775 RepID=A0A9P9YKC0_9MUSC|nr:hypothetical protein M5D96_008513 [Drosophila gunungcola]